MKSIENGGSDELAQYFGTNQRGRLLQYRFIDPATRRDQIREFDNLQKLASILYEHGPKAKIGLPDSVKMMLREGAESAQPDPDSVLEFIRHG